MLLVLLLLLLLVSLQAVLVPLGRPWATTYGLMQQ